jgi:hypothetical protein
LFDDFLNITNDMVVTLAEMFGDFEGFYECNSIFVYWVLHGVSYKK